MAGAEQLLAELVNASYVVSVSPGGNGIVEIVGSRFGFSLTSIFGIMTAVALVLVMLQAAIVVVARGLALRRLSRVRKMQVEPEERDLGPAPARDREATPHPGQKPDGEDTITAADAPETKR